MDVLQSILLTVLIIVVVAGAIFYSHWAESNAKELFYLRAEMKSLQDFAERVVKVYFDVEALNSAYDMDMAPQRQYYAEKGEGQVWDQVEWHIQDEEGAILCGSQSGQYSLMKPGELAMPGFYRTVAGSYSGIESEFLRYMELGERA